MTELVPPDARLIPVTAIVTPFEKHFVWTDEPTDAVACSVHVPLGAQKAIKLVAPARQGRAAQDTPSPPASNTTAASFPGVLPLLPQVATTTGAASAKTKVARRRSGAGIAGR